MGEWALVQNIVYSRTDFLLLTNIFSYLGAFKSNDTGYNLVRDEITAKDRIR